MQLASVVAFSGGEEVGSQYSKTSQDLVKISNTITLFAQNQYCNNIT